MLSQSLFIIWLPFSFYLNRMYIFKEGCLFVHYLFGNDQSYLTRNYSGVFIVSNESSTSGFCWEHKDSSFRIKLLLSWTIRLRWLSLLLESWKADFKQVEDTEKGFRDVEVEYETFFLWSLIDRLKFNSNKPNNSTYDNFNNHQDRNRFMFQCSIFWMRSPVFFYSLFF